MDEYSDKKIQWVNSVPIFKNSVILKQLSIAIGIPFGLVVVFILAFSGVSRDLLYAIGLIISVLVFTYVFINLVYNGRYEAEFTVDGKGVRCRLIEKQENKIRIINALTVLAGFLSKKPAVSGIGILANTKLNVFISWDRARKVKYIDKGYIIIIKGDLIESIALFCTIENYSGVKNFIRGKIND